MSKPTAILQVVLDNPSKVFFSGEIITGLVKFQAEQQHKVQLLAVNLNAEYYSIKNDQECVELIYTETCPLDLRSAGEGNTEMPFSIVVRPDSPTSIASTIGGIKYRVVSILLYKEGDRVQRVEAAEYLSVNAQKQLTEEMGGQKVTAQEGWNLIPSCCGAIFVDFEVACAALLCGHSAIINACITNGTSFHIQGTSVSLIQKMCRLRDKKIIKCTVATKERGAILPGKRQVWLSDRFLIPPLPPSGVDPYFKVSYKLIMVIQKTSTKGMRLKIPIVIGNLPRSKDTQSLSTQCSLGADITDIVEGRCSNFSSDVHGFKPLYVSYIS
ncbi:arrestin domain-containing protein 17 [Halyomorpha halys]|uniref:arrestin domain-containing protein 17 n=1 Tax=Halyomorpha halys TaxID=286706 RepID=UPI0006D4FDA2|nr:arrestin domain-containing protein 3-like [Halyomorpha halys]